MTVMTLRTFWMSVLVAAAWLMSATGPAAAALPSVVNGQPVPSLAPLVKQVSPAVVNIQVTSTRKSSRNPFADDPLTRRFFNIPEQPAERQIQGAGSGVIVDASNGYIITNHHVVAGADEIKVTLRDDRTLPAEIVGSDEGSDIAVLKVGDTNLVDIPFGDSDGLEPGDFVIAIGNPFGLSHTVTSGIVSALGRTGIGGLGTDLYEDFIQTDASINPGNSGGALVNLRGELVGINSAILSRSGGNIGIGFAIPSNMTQSIMRQILDFGEVRRGLLGVVINSINADNAEAFGLKNVTGAIVTSIEPNSAADHAGLEVGDVVTAVDGKKVDSSQELRNTIGLRRGGDDIEITLLREGKVRKVKAKLGDKSQLSAGTGSEIHPGLEGAAFASASAAGSGRGVEIVSVEPGSPAQRAQLAAGDVILQVNRQRVNSVAELKVLAADGGVLWMLIRRDGATVLRQVR